MQLFDRDGRRKYTNASERVRFLDSVLMFGIRKKAFCLLMDYSGVRISEALAVRRYHVEPDAVTFRTLKRRREHWRRVPLPPWLCTMLLSLPRLEGDPDCLWSWNRSTGYRWIKRGMQFAQIRGPQATARGLRHGFCVRAVNKDVPVTLVQRWAGHADVATTAIYLDVGGDEENAFAARTW